MHYWLEHSTVLTFYLITQSPFIYLLVASAEADFLLHAFPRDFQGPSESQARDLAVCKKDLMVGSWHAVPCWDVLGSLQSHAKWCRKILWKRFVFICCFSDPVTHCTVWANPITDFQVHISEALYEKVVGQSSGAWSGEWCTSIIRRQRGFAEQKRQPAPPCQESSWSRRTFPES